jgi:hypothetical protein
MADAIISLATGDERLMELQAVPFMLINPTPPSVDIFPADPFQDVSSFGPGSRRTLWTARARVSTADDVSGQEVLLLLMEVNTDTSLRHVLENDSGVAALVDGISVGGPTGYRLYREPSPSQDLQHQGALLGCEWQITADITQEFST